MNAANAETDLIIRINAAPRRSFSQLAHPFERSKEGFGKRETQCVGLLLFTASFIYGVRGWDIMAKAGSA